MDILQKEYDFYKANKENLMKKYNHKYIALKDQKVITSADSKEKAVKYMLGKEYKLGEFLVHLVSEKSDLIHRYYSRVK